MVRTEAGYFFFFNADCPLSNWYPAEFLVKGVKFTHGEQLLMFCKAKLFGDEHHAEKILLAKHPKDQKAFGRQVRGFNGALWEQKREHYDYIGVLSKCQQNPQIADYLLNTGDLELVEAAPHDPIWGVGLDMHSPAILHKRLWRGLNLHGINTQRARDTLRGLPFSV